MRKRAGVAEEEEMADRKEARRRRAGWRLAAAGMSALLSACTVGPNYVRPTAPVPPAYKESAGWKVAQPRDNEIRGAWWEAFGDPRLSEILVKVGAANQDVAAAEARVRQAQALLGQSRAASYPVVTAGASATRTGRATGTSNAFSLPVNASWELDLWGRVRRNVEAGRAGVQASRADLESVLLSARADAAQNYFQLRELDAEKRLLDETIAAFRKTLELTQARYAGGVASKADVLQAQTQLSTAEAQAIDVGVQRAQLEHAIAQLAGEPASAFSLPSAPLDGSPPAIPVGVPSALLERRPDIAGAERRVAAANALIGAAQAAWYPTVTLGGSAGFAATDASKWLSWPSRFWAVGPSILETVFDGGLRASLTDQARAAYDADVAAYRQAVLTGFQEVEDNLSALRILEEEARAQDEAVAAARQTLSLVEDQYKGGIVSYLNVVVAQTTALGNERTARQILGRRMVASVLLIKALGGGWSAAALR